MNRRKLLLLLSLAVLNLAVNRGGAKVVHEPGPEKVPAGLTAADWSSIRQEYERRRHGAFAVGGEYRARNHGQQWLTRFDGRGFTVEPESKNWRWGLELKSYGFPGRERAVEGRAQVSTAVERVSYRWDQRLEEWFVNDRRGLEHGFTLRERPAGTGRLVLRLAIRGGLPAQVEPDGQGVRFGEAIRYSGLQVWDAAGRKLAARFETAGEGLALRVEESGARYPLTIDPVAQQAYLKASNTGAVDGFGDSVAVSGDTVVVGAPFESSNATGVNGNQADNSAFDSGAAYVFGLGVFGPGCSTHVHSHSFPFGHGDTGAHGFGHSAGDPRHGHHFVCSDHIPGHGPGSAFGLQIDEGEALGNVGFVAAMNQDGSSNDRAPAKRGTVLQLFGSAAGLYIGENDEPAARFTAPASGAPLYTTALPEVRIGGAPAQVLFSGMAPGLTGVWQLNVRVPEAAPSGASVPVTIFHQGWPVKSVAVAIE